ncbi:hypothetical protein [Nakamurella sp. PAMC28650]|uniref:hypothetical protein n=1 Tax=Nakamurella sp. PAMC28650 TaxID=2762325 RepID=UPI00164CF1AA|nr:hypothetical protein [Nakamurella sp. PAMC28650]QNK82903.1 hypothetical protein H7F38_09665 [Nakamurella sp. PAMC28650]
MASDEVAKLAQARGFAYPAELRLRWPWQLARIAVVRARRLSVLGQPNTASARMLGWIGVPALVGMQMVMVGRTSDRVYQWRSASVTLDDGRKAQIRPVLWLTGVIGGIATQMVILLLPILVIAVLLTRGIQVPPIILAILELAMVVYFLSVVIAEVARDHRRKREPESPLPLLERRRNQLAEEGAAWLLTSLACGRKGQARHLFGLLTPSWQAQAAVVVLYPAEESLIEVYRRWGGQLDTGAQRRIVFDYRSDLRSTNQT